MLVEQIIQKKIELKEEQMLKSKRINYLKAISHFYSAYSLALAVLKQKDPKSSKKWMIWRKFLAGDLPEYQEKRLLKLLNFMDEDSSAIINAQKLLTKQKEENAYASSNLDRKDAIAMLSYEYE